MGVALRLQVNLAVLRQNMAALRKLTSAKICAVVKADAYGHGLQILSALQESDEWAVSSIGEAVEIAELSDKPINILSLPDKTVVRAYRKNICPSVASAEDIAFATHNGATAVNIKVNTGMNRYGVATDSLEGLLHACDSCGVRVKSVFSHIYVLSEAQSQFERFMQCVMPLRDYIPQKHIAASNFAYLPAYMHLDMVRPGIVLYGYGHTSVRPIATATCTITQIRNISAHENIGYGYCMSGIARRIAVLSAGYADGCRRITDNAPRYVEIAGCLCPIVGQICMDAMMADIANLDVHVGDTAIVSGRQYGADALAVSCGTIPYEILTGWSKRVRREYIDAQ